MKSNGGHPTTMLHSLMFPLKIFWCQKPRDEWTTRRGNEENKNMKTWDDEMELKGNVCLFEFEQSGWRMYDVLRLCTAWSW